ncbi:MAG TPA: LuxR C-terminal-related transcriptional regulator [Streptosporangiaceae bacterium]|nr:LuxR C-terminal-related transcriptional regulator [Streptosporangiaceae bacterium]
MVANVARPVTARAGRSAGEGRDPILSSKITVPGGPAWMVPRPRITELIDRGLRRCPLTVVTGPPGAGKTMALAMWAAARSGPVAWLSLDEYDNRRPGVFWAYLAAALRRAGVALPRALPSAGRGRTAEHLFLLRLAEALSAHEPPVLLVLDDFHVMTQPKVLEGLDFLLRNAGPGLRLVICSRMDPLLPLHRYRLAGELAEIRASDLAFTVAEAGLLLARHGIALPADSLEYLTQRTEGWAAGIRLAALSMDGHPDPGQFVKMLTAEDNALTSYLIEEVLGAQPPEVQEVLLCTSILEHVSSDCAGELTGNSRAAGILKALAHANAFVRPIGGGWYRYHTMVAEVLRLKLRHRSPDRIPGLHQRAAHWYQRHGCLTDAVRHAVRADDWQFAAAVVIDALAVGQIIGPGRGQSLAEEFAGMPQHTWDTPQPCLVAAALALVDAGPEAAAVRLAAAERALSRVPADQQAAGRLAAALIRLAAARRTGDLAAAAAAAASAESLLHDVPRDNLPPHHEIRAEILASRGAVELWSGRFDEAARTLRSGVAAATTAGGDHARADCLGSLALAEALRGRLSRAGELADEAMTAFTSCESRPPAQYPNPAALLAVAWVQLENEGLREATDLLRQLDSVLTVSPDKLLGAVACLIAARGGLAEGRTTVAAQYLAKARAGWSVPAWLEKRLSLAESRATVAQDGARPLAAAQHGDPRPAPLSASGQAGPLIVEPLTEREQEVLRHVAHMLSTAEVAGAMYISTNTVKTHLKSIFRKLAAGHRGEAVRRARELELI